MLRTTIILSSIFAGTAVATGALGAHALAKKVSEGILTQQMLDSYETAVKYQMYHAFAILAAGILFHLVPLKPFRTAVWLFTAGILLFSGSIYLLSVYPVLGIGKPSFLGPVTPIGGLLFMAGWILMLVGGIKIKKTE